MNQEITHRSIVLLLKRDNDFREESAVKLIEGINEKPHWVDPKTGETIDVKNLSLGEMIERNLKRVGISGWHRFDDAYRRYWTKMKFTGEGHIDKALNEAYMKGQNDFGNVFGDKIRSVSVGDVFIVDEWGADGIATSNPRFFLVADTGFDEFKRATGEFL